MANISDDQMQEYKDAFSLFDKRGDNCIDTSQLGDVLRALGQNPTEAEVKKARADIEASGSKRMSFETFLPIYLSVQRNAPNYTAKDYIEGLRVFDKEGNGTISSAELRHVLTTLGEPMEDKEVDELIAGLEDTQGCVNYSELIKMLLC